MLLSACGLYGLGMSASVVQYAIWGCVLGFGTAISMPSSMAVASTLDDRQGRVFGMTQLAAGAGLLLGPILGGLVVQASYEVGRILQVVAILGACLCIPLLWSILDRHLHWGRGYTLVLAVSCCVLIVGVGVTPILYGGASRHFDERSVYTYTDVAMGTVVTLTLQTESRKAADDAAHKTIAFIRALQRDYDFRSTDGSVARINRAAGRTWVHPSRRTFDLLQRTVALSKKTGGVFDPTIGAATTSPLYYALDESVLKAKQNLVNYRLLKLDDATGRVMLKKTGMALDLGGIAKGAVIDAAVALLRELHIKAGIVEAGGDFYCFGHRWWTVGIRHPRTRQVYGLIRIREKGVCGSGDYQQFVMSESNGQHIKRHHVLDPISMAPATEAIGVTVVAATAEEADALATTLMIAGAEDGLFLLDKEFPGTSAVWFQPDMTVVKTANFPE
ncbi:hypothetical protein PSDVSF_06160 [Pseudodesulfovibrio sediminis]|uniref:FAD:protein FMN transferase n=2 Tax=Pseudodesulfovibrio sediminis TaxID=2810563 RepID=A0ABM7P3E3_9BACT|nr:hypothetical protein PSDVSF_06160 [Pseudodesulfovibrio sediminis]